MSSLPKYYIRRSTRAKRLSLNISQHKGLEVVAPFHLSEKAIDTFVLAHQRWIKKHQHLIEASQKPFFPPSRIHLLAIQRQWQITYGQLRPKQPSIEVFPQKILIQENTPSKQYFNTLMRFFLKKVAAEHLTPQLESLSQQHRLPFKQHSFRLQKTRWGSCTQKENISLNSALLFMPASAVQYVMLHELCHTEHLNHSARFWKKLASIMPDYLEHQKILRRSDLYLPNWIDSL
jgi:predicted metal-dependent hydrolase